MGNDAVHVLVVDDEAAVAWTLQQALEAAQCEVRVAASAEKALRSLAQARPDVVITDIRMPGMDGLEFLAQCQKRYPLLPIIVMTAHGTMETAVEAVRRGAFDYVSKPLDLDTVSDAVMRAAGESGDEHSIVADHAVDHEHDGIVGSSPAMQDVYRRVAAAAASDTGVLVQGETGTGKELVARALHRHSARAQKPFIAVNCAALPNALVESELFGHEAGAFTDARQAAPGRIAAANGGTLFLDEVGELPPVVQAKLLRFLEDRRYTRIGGSLEYSADVRIVAATNRDLSAAAEEGLFRSDLLFRLQIVRVYIPPLRERMQDIEDLVPFLLAGIAERLGKRIELQSSAQQKLLGYRWPGNVRELKHVLEEAAVLVPGGVIGAEQLHLDGSAAIEGGVPFDYALEQHIKNAFARSPGQVHEELLRQVERVAVELALAHTGGNQLRAAELLGINRMTVKKIRDAGDISRGTTKIHKRLKNRGIDFLH